MQRHRLDPGLRLATAAVATVVLAACGGGGATPLVHRGDVVPVAAGSLTARDVGDAQTAFGVDLLHAVCRHADEGNVLVSPTSAAEALTLLYPAAGGQTAEAVGGLLHLPEWSSELVAALRAHTRALDGLRYDGDLDDDDAPDSLQMSNRLWTATDLEPDPGYLEDIATGFDADVRALDFAGDPDGATERINTTVTEDTRGIIEELFEEPLDPSTTAVLTNALHLKARWAAPFTGTQSAPFTAPSGKVDVDMMDGATGAVRTADEWQSVELPYRDDTLAGVAVLPPEGTDPCTVDAATLAGLQEAAPAEVGVRLPQLRIDQSHQLLDVLAGMGLPVDGDYSALGLDRLRISGVAQKALRGGRGRHRGGRRDGRVHRGLGDGGAPARGDLRPPVPVRPHRHGDALAPVRHRRPRSVDLSADRRGASGPGSAGPVLLVGDVCAPRGVVVLPDGGVHHEVVRRRAVPVLLPGWRVDHVAGADDHDLAAAGLDQADSVGDVQGLSQGVRVPGGARAGGEADRVDADARGRLTPGDDVEPDVPGEQVRRALGARLLRQDLHDVSFRRRPPQV